MMTLTSIAQWIVRLTGPTQVVLGLLFWTGRALTLLPLHMLIGMLFVLGLLVLAGLAAWAGLRWRLVLPTVALGVVIPLFGIVQSRLLPGPGHWVVKLAHLLIGIVAMVVAARLARFIRSNPRRARVLAAESLTLG
jgi:hypothetical protein